jgi:tubulin delta
MSMICVQAGQCGNQVGLSLLNALYDHISPLSVEGNYNAELEAFFRPTDDNPDSRLGFFGDYYTTPGNSHLNLYNYINAPKLKARAVCIDTEPKVVNSIYNTSRTQRGWEYESMNVLYRHGGAGNNWALGYQMCTGTLLEEALDSVRRELEQCDRVPFILELHSTAGGTGSGLGTRFTEALATEFPDTIRINVCVVPYRFGEVAVQHYNSVLCLSKTSSASDSVIIVQNDAALQQVKLMHRIETPSLFDINQVIAGNLVPFLLPKRQYGRQASASSLPDDVMSLCSHPAYRYLEARSIPQTSRDAIEFTYDKWDSLGGTLRRMLQAGMQCERQERVKSVHSSYATTVHDSVTSTNTVSGSSNTISEPDAAGDMPEVATVNRAVGSIFALRGPDAHTAEGTAATLIGDPALRAMHCALLPTPLQVFHSPHLVNGYQRSMGALTNGTGCLPVLQHSSQRAAAMFAASAYVHQYENYGLEQAELVDCFRHIGQNIADYQALGTMPVLN